MANLFVFFSLLVATNAAVLTGLNLDPERLKVVNYMVQQGNDYMDYNPEDQPSYQKEIVVQVPETNVVIGVPEDQRTYIQVSKSWSDDGRVEHSISLQPVAAPAQVDIQFPATQDVRFHFDNQYRQ